MPVEPRPAAPEDSEDAKILTLARSARARVSAAEGACVRDTDGRTYAAASVDLPSLRLSAVQLAVATAASSGVRGLEAVAVVGEATAADESDLAAVRDLAGAGVTVFVAAPDATVVATSTS